MIPDDYADHGIVIFVDCKIYAGIFDVTKIANEFKYITINYDIKQVKFHRGSDYSDDKDAITRNMIHVAHSKPRNHTGECLLWYSNQICIV